jgi:hypothetical protein
MLPVLMLGCAAAEAPAKLPIASVAPFHGCAEDQSEALRRAGFIVSHEVQADGRIAVRLRNVGPETRDVRRVAAMLALGECGRPAASCVVEPPSRVGPVPPDGTVLLVASPPDDPRHACTSAALGVLVWLDRDRALCADAGGWTAVAAEPAE